MFAKLKAIASNPRKPISKKWLVGVLLYQITFLTFGLIIVMFFPSRAPALGPILFLCVGISVALLLDVFESKTGIGHIEDEGNSRIASTDKTAVISKRSTVIEITAVLALAGIAIFMLKLSIDNEKRENTSLAMLELSTRIFQHLEIDNDINDLTTVKDLDKYAENWFGVSRVDFKARWDIATFSTSVVTEGAKKSWEVEFVTEDKNLCERVAPQVRKFAKTYVAEDSGHITRMWMKEMNFDDHGCHAVNGGYHLDFTMPVGASHPNNGDTTK